MYKKAYGILETLAPLYVGATAGEERGNVNLVFRDSFTKTGIIPGSSIRGRLRSEVYLSEGEKRAKDWYGRAAGEKDEEQAENGNEASGQSQKEQAENGNEASGQKESIKCESRIKIEYASIVWLPVFCSGQPIVWVSCPRLLARYRRIVGDFVKVGDKLLKDKSIPLPDPYTGSLNLKGKKGKNDNQILFFNLGFIETKKTEDLSPWFPPLETMFGHSDVTKLPALVVEDKDMGMIHDMALYRQSRVSLEKDQKIVKGGAFFNVEALPEGTLMVFPIGLKQEPNQKGEPLDWKPLNGEMEGDIFLGGLESVGFGHCYMNITVDKNANKEA